MRKLTYFVASTIDGFSCGPDGATGFFPFAPDTKDFMTAKYPETLPTVVRGLLGIDDAENQQYDSILQGKGSYQIALDEGVTSPYAHAKQYVFSTALATDLDPAVTIVDSDPCDYVRGLKQDSGLGLCLLGGPAIAGALLPEIDELVVKRYPIVAGHGKPLSRTAFAPGGFQPEWTHAFASGADYTLFRRVREG